MNMKAIDNPKTTISLSEISSPSHLIDFVMKTSFFFKNFEIHLFLLYFGESYRLASLSCDDHKILLP